MSKESSPWDTLDLENQKPDNEEAQQLRLDLKRKFQICFGTEAGKFVLEHLTGRAYLNPVVDEHAVNVLASAGIREGEIRGVKYIHLMMQPEK